tara:strand:- start:1083 stop:1817 length:735 start_codon:yes stop_codon:yes gene_type:complete
MSQMNPRVEQWIDAYWRTGDINLENLDGAILKCAEGVNYLSDPERMDWLKTQIDHAKAAGKPWQYYGFGRPDLRPGASNGAAEALDMLGTIEDVGPPSLQYYADGSKASVWIDLERDCDAPKAEVRAWLWAWFETVEAGAGGQWAGIYSSGSWLDDNIGSDDETMARVFTREDGSFRPMWAARYGDSKKTYPPNLVKYPITVKAPNWYLLKRSPGPVVAQWTSSREEGGTVNGKGHDSNLVYLR